jgi:acylphosphatase
MAEDLASVTILVTGQVQGVFYRASTLEQAQRLGLTGWVKNLADGGVEIVAEGPRWALEQLVEWAKVGPPAAEVEHVSARYGAHRSEYRTFMIVR